MLRSKKLAAADAKVPATIDSLCGARRQVDITSARLGDTLGSNFPHEAASALKMSTNETN